MSMELLVPVLIAVVGVVVLGVAVAFLLSRRKRAQALSVAPLTVAVPVQYTTAVPVQPTTRREYRASQASSD